MQELTVQLAGPFTFLGAGSIFDTPEGAQGGVYLFTFQIGERYVVEYVGITSRSFAERTQEHVREFLAGGYKIYDMEACVQGERTVLWPGRFGAEGRRDVREYVAQAGDLLPRIHAQLEAYRIFCIPTSDRRLAERVEGAMYEHLKVSEDALVRTWVDPEVQYDVRRTEEDKIELTLTSNTPSLLIPHSLTV